MELIYTASKSSKNRKDWVVDETPICCLSPRNTIAFTSSHSLLEDSSSADAVEALHHVYVCDIDKPWDIHLVTRSTENVVALQWNESATRLIIATALGKIQVWSMKDYLLNKWVCTSKATIEGEEIVSLGWLHTGVRVNFHADKIENVPYAERMARAQFSPSLCHFGGKATVGIITITASGMVVVGLLRSGDNMDLQTESLGAWQGRLKIADFTYEASGDIIVAASDGQIGSPIQCYKVSLKKEYSSCAITCKPMASLYANCNRDSKLRESNTGRVTHIQFIQTQCGEVLIVGAGDVNTSHVEMWQLMDHQPSYHKFFQSGGLAGSSTPPQTSPRYSTHKWVHRSRITHGSLPVSIAIPRFPVMYSSGDNSNTLFQYVAVSYRDGSVKLINRHTFQLISTTNLDTGICEIDQGEKRMRTLPYMAHMQQTFTGCSLVGLDQFSCLYVMRAVNNMRDPMTMVAPVFLVSMLEYSMIMGYDWWDVLASLRQGLVENVIQKLSDNFVKQPGATQELLYARFLSMKASLCKVNNIGQQRAADCHCQIMLHSLATAFKSLLRPKVMSASDSGPAEKLSTICSKSLEPDIDKVIVALNTDKKDFIVEPQTLQALQPLIQWVADLTLYLLSCLPMLQGHSSTFPGAVLVQDAGALSMLRELLVIIRIWGSTNTSCLPHFTTTSPNFDCLPHLYRLLTKVWMIRNDSRSIDEDDALLDDCCLLPSQAMIPQVDQALFGDTNYRSSINFQPQPQKYTFNQVAKHASRSAHQVVLPDGSVAPQQCRDVVRFVYLGIYPLQQMRECCRCGCLSLLEAPAQVSALLAWDMRWSKACPCGGHWKVKNPSVDILV